MVAPIRTDAVDGRVPAGGVQLVLLVGLGQASEMSRTSAYQATPRPS